MNQVFQPVAPPGFGPGYGETGECCDGDRGRHCGGIDVVAGTLDECFDQCFAAGDESAGRAERLAESPDQHRHVLYRIPARIDQADAFGAVHAHAVGVVDHDPGIPSSGDSDQVIQPAPVPVHAESAVADDQFAVGIARELPVQVVAVQVGVPGEPRTAYPSAVQ